MSAEVEHLADGGPELGWAAGCVAASYRTARALETFTYVAALLFGVAAMTFDQWTEDEGLGTCVVLGLIAFLLGLVRPKRFAVSGVAVGAVVAGVHVLGALGGVRPPYETRAHSLVDGLLWLVFVIPAVLAAAAGSRLARAVHST